MTKEEKDLLLKDLCARLPYKVKVEIKNVCKVCTLEEIDCSDDEMSVAVKHENGELAGYDFDLAKPYLFPLESMTEEQREEWHSLMVRDAYGILYHTIESFDYLYKNHIDIRGSITKGLAKNATRLNIY